MIAGRRRWLFLGVLTVVGVIGLSPRVYRDLRGLSLVIRGADLQGAARRVADLTTVPHVERLIFMPLGRTTITARVFAPAATSRQTVLLVSGLHAAGIDEPRLRALAGELARTGVTVVTPAIPELSQFEITSVLTDRIEQAAGWLAHNADLAPDGQIGLMGISFSGGLSIVAAGRPSLRERLRYVLSFGGHDDLPRVLQYLSAGAGTPGTPVPHDYGVAVVLLNVAGELVPPDQVRPLRDGVRRFLWASYLDGVDRASAEREFAAVRALAPRLPDPAGRLLGLVSNRDVVTLGALLAPHVGAYAESPALSPSRSPLPSAPVFLLHGKGDTVIPAAESESLAGRLEDRRVPVRLLLTGLISHAEADQPARVMDVLRLAAFWGDLLAR